MDDDVTGVDEHPVAMRHALDANVRKTGLVQVLEHAVRNSADLPIGPAGGHNHEVSDCGLAGEIDGDRVLSLHIVDSGEDEAKSLLGVRAHLGDWFGGAMRASPGDCSCGQGTSFRFLSLHSPRPGEAEMQS